MNQGQNGSKHTLTGRSLVFFLTPSRDILRWSRTRIKQAGFSLFAHWKVQHSGLAFHWVGKGKEGCPKGFALPAGAAKLKNWQK
jgi:hypothetical protein